MEDGSTHLDNFRVLITEIGTGGRDDLGWQARRENSNSLEVVFLAVVMTACV